MKPVLLPIRAHRGPGGQTGVMLLEALLAILIFSVGILAIVAMEARAVQDVGESKYRSDAAFLANQIVADMWGNSTSLASYAYPGTGTVPGLLSNWMTSASKRLPGVDVASKKNLPTIVVGANNMVTVTIFWQQGHDLGLPAHRYQLVAYVNCCQ